MLEHKALPLAPQVLVTSFEANSGRLVHTHRDILRDADESWLARVRLRLPVLPRLRAFISRGNTTPRHRARPGVAP